MLLIVMLCVSLFVICCLWNVVRGMSLCVAVCCLWLYVCVVICVVVRCVVVC